MTTELITFKMDHSLLEEVDRTSKAAGFQNRTEFIRNALREKIEELRLKQAMITLSKLKGKSPKITSDKERARIREKVFEEFEKKII